MPMPQTSRGERGMSTPNIEINKHRYERITNKEDLQKILDEVCIIADENGDLTFLTTDEDGPLNDLEMELIVGIEEYGHFCFNLVDIDYAFEAYTAREAYVSDEQ